jgi:hypothetical protein
MQKLIIALIMVIIALQITMLILIEKVSASPTIDTKLPPNLEMIIEET